MGKIFGFMEAQWGHIPKVEDMFEDDDADSYNEADLPNRSFLNRISCGCMGKKPTLDKIH